MGKAFTGRSKVSWQPTLVEAIVRKSKKRLSREWVATGAMSRAFANQDSKEKHKKLLKKLRKAGVKPGMEGKTYRSELDAKSGK